MNLDELKVLVAVVEHGSLAAAAKTLRFPIATLRRRLDELEVRMGVKLLERSRHGVVPTSAGALLVDRSRGLLREFQGLAELVRHAGDEPSGEIAIAAPGLPPGLISSFLVLMKDLYPALSWRFLFVEDPVRAFTSEMHGAVCLRKEAPEGPWEARAMLTIPERLMASPAYLERHGTPGSVEELGKHRLLLWEGPERRGNVLPLLDGSRVSVTPSVRMNDIFILRQCAARGDGIAFVPDAQLPPGPLFGDEGLVPVLEDQVGGRITAWMLAAPAVFALPRMQLAFAQIASLTAALQG